MLLLAAAGCGGKGALGPKALQQQATGLQSLAAEGGILAGLVLGAIVAFLIDRRFVWAAGFCGAGAVLSWIGLIHGEKVEWGANGQVALGYLFAGIVCAAFVALRLPERVTDPEEAELENA